MNPREELEQQLWEFVFELLTPEQADAMRKRITSEPDVARLYAEVKLQTEIVAEAVKIRHPAISLTRPDSASDQAAFDPSADAPVRAARVLSASRPANWLATLAASLLLCYLGHAYFQPVSPLRKDAVQAAGENLARQGVRAKLVGPDQLQPLSDNFFIVQTQDTGGESRATQVAYRFCEEDGTRVLEEGRCTTDSNGFAKIRVAADIPWSRVRLEVRPETPVAVRPVSRTLSVHKGDLSTHLTTDRTVYQPGDTVQFRSVTLSRYDLEVRRDVPVEITVLGPDGLVVSGSQSTVQTNQGVGDGAIDLPENLQTAEHQIVAASKSDEFPEVRRTFHVRHYDVPKLRKRIDFGRGSYGPGDQVVVDFSVQRAEGGAVRNEPIKIIADVDGERIVDEDAETDDRGKYQHQFRLPKEMERREGSIQLIVGKPDAERIVEDIPIHTGDVFVEFFPESGDLVTGVKNRVYFFAHDTLDKPVHIEGHIQDGNGNHLQDVQTDHDGRGVFELRPATQHAYDLVAEIENSTRHFTLPEADKQQFLTLNTGPGVFSAGSDIALDVYALNSTRPVLISAVCRGTVVGQEMVSAEQLAAGKEGTEPSHVRLEVSDEASGVIRLTAYDVGVSQLEPVAERLVFRHPAQKLEIDAKGLSGPFRPGDQVDLKLAVTDEDGDPQEAVLGVSVVDEAALSLARDRSDSLTTHFWLTGQIDNARGLEDANLYLEETPAAERWLDLLLGTQGWRRIRSVPAARLAAAGSGRDFGFDAFDTKDASLGLAKNEHLAFVADEPTAPMLLADNEKDAIRAVRGKLNSFALESESGARRISRVLFFGGLALVISLVLLAVMRRVTATAWIPALGAGALCLVLGGVWMLAQLDHTSQLATLLPADGSESAVVAAVPVSEESIDAATDEKDATIAEKMLSPDKGALSNDKGTATAEGETGSTDGAEKQVREPSVMPYEKRGNDGQTDYDIAEEELAEQDSIEQKPIERKMVEQEEEGIESEASDKETPDAYGGQSNRALFGATSELSDMPKKSTPRAAEPRDRSLERDRVFDAPRPDRAEEIPRPAADPQPETNSPALQMAMPAEEADAARSSNNLAEGKVAERAARLKDDMARRRVASKPASRGAETMPGRPADLARELGEAGGYGGGRADGGAAGADAGAGGAGIAGKTRAGESTDSFAQETLELKLDAAAENPAPADPAMPAGKPFDAVGKELPEVRAEPSSRPQPAPAQLAMPPEPSGPAAPESPVPGAIAAEFQPRGAPDVDNMRAPDALDVIVPGAMAEDSPAVAEGLGSRASLSQKGQQSRKEWAKKKEGPLDDAPLFRAGEDGFRGSYFAREYARQGLATRGLRNQTPPEETVLWEPLLTVDENGQTQLQFSLPDVETTYRILVNGHVGGRLGSYRGQIVAKQPDTNLPVEIADPQQ